MAIVNLAPVPTLDQLLADPGKAMALPPEVARDLVPPVAALLAALQVRALKPDGAGQAVPTEDQLLTVEDAARKLGVSPDWLYRRAAKLPFTVRLGRQLRFSSAAIEQYIRQRRER